jgi:hypothetical protein
MIKLVARYVYYILMHWRRRRDSTLPNMRAVLVGMCWFATLEILKRRDLLFPA